MKSWLPIDQAVPSYRTLSHMLPFK